MDQQMSGKKVTDTRLAARQQRFVDEYLVDLDATAAAIRAGYSKTSAGTLGTRLLADDKVQAEVKRKMAARAAQTDITASDVLRRLWSIATADVNQLVQHQRVCCRHCWGVDHRYQWTEIEYESAVTAAKASGAAEPDPVGGFGYRRDREPHPECPECAGLGHSHIHAVDTRRLGEQARLLYAGAKLGKHGLEIMTHDQLKALELVGRHLGMFDPRLRLTPETADTLRDFLNALQGTGLEPGQRNNATGDDTDGR